MFYDLTLRRAQWSLSDFCGFWERRLQMAGLNLHGKGRHVVQAHCGLMLKAAVLEALC